MQNWNPFVVESGQRWLSRYLVWKFTIQKGQSKVCGCVRERTGGVSINTTLLQFEFEENCNILLLKKLFWILIFCNAASKVIGLIVWFDGFYMANNSSQQIKNKMYFEITTVHTFLHCKAANWLQLILASSACIRSTWSYTKKLLLPLSKIHDKDTIILQT